MAKPKKQQTETKTRWENRIIGSGDESPAALLASPFNFRIHPKRQQDALKGSLDTLGYIQTVIVNQKTQHIIDGHLRVIMALREGQKSIPVTYVDLSEAEEAQALLSLDPIAALAATDSSKVDELLRMVNTDNEQVMKHLADFAAENNVTPPQFKEYGEDAADGIKVCRCSACGNEHAAKKENKTGH